MMRTKASSKKVAETLYKLGNGKTYIDSVQIAADRNDAGSSYNAYASEDGKGVRELKLDRFTGQSDGYRLLKDVRS